MNEKTINESPYGWDLEEQDYPAMDAANQDGFKDKQAMSQEYRQQDLFPMLFENANALDLYGADDKGTEIQFELAGYDTYSPNRDKFDFDRIIYDLNTQIDLLSSQADQWDYLVAVASGIVTSLLSELWVGDFNLERGRSISSKKVEKLVMRAAEFTEKKKFKDLKSAVRALEEHFPIPSDGNTDVFGGGRQHHLRDFAHHPTIVGLIFSIMTQRTKMTYGTDKAGNFITKEVKGEYLNLIGNTTSEKIRNGVIVWFFHMVSDIAGSSSTAGTTGGTGLPGPILSLAKEISSIKFFKTAAKENRPMSVFISKLFNGTMLADHDESGKIIKGTELRFDYRTEKGIGIEIRKMALPVIANEAIVRGFYFIRRLAMEMKDKHISSLEDMKRIDWKAVKPANNPTIARMLTISTGVFTTVDVSEAILTKGKEFWVSVNYIGVGRFAVAIGQDISWGLKARSVREIRDAYETIKWNTYQRVDRVIYNKIAADIDLFTNADTRQNTSGQNTIRLDQTHLHTIQNPDRNSFRMTHINPTPSPGKPAGSSGRISIRKDQPAATAGHKAISRQCEPCADTYSRLDQGQDTEPVDLRVPGNGSDRSNGSDGIKTRNMEKTMIGKELSAEKGIEDTTIEDKMRGTFEGENSASKTIVENDLDELVLNGSRDETNMSFQKEADKMGLTLEQTIILYNIEYFKIKNDIDKTNVRFMGEAVKELKRAWLKEWQEFIAEGFESFTQIKGAKMKWYSPAELHQQIYLNDADEPWYRLTLLEAMLFQPYYALSVEKDKDGQETLSHKYDMLTAPFTGFNIAEGDRYLNKAFTGAWCDKGYVTRLRKSYDAQMRELNEVMKSLLTSLSITAGIAALLIATAGAFTGPIAVALVGSKFAGLSGAALTSACLAYLGGGAIAAGGAGMLGGSIAIVGGGAVLGAGVGASVGGAAMAAGLAGKEKMIRESAKLMTAVKEIFLNDEHDVEFSDYVYETYLENLRNIEKGLVDLRLKRDTETEKEKKKLNETIKQAEESVEAMKIALKSMRRFNSSFTAGL